MTIWTKSLGLLSFVLLLSSCTGCKDKSVSDLDAEKAKQVPVHETKTYDENVPDACTLITTQQIAAVIGVDPSGISIKDGSNLKSLNVRSCFFRWEHEGVPNSGVLVQAQSNPLPDDFPNWSTTYIKSKIEGGEKSLDNEVFLYKPFNGGGIEGAYNHEMSKYFWRLDDQLIYTITFNLGADEPTQLAWAEKLASMIK